MHDHTKANACATCISVLIEMVAVDVHSVLTQQVSADCVFTGFDPPEGKSVVTGVKHDIILTRCDFTGSSATSGAQGLVGAYMNASALPASSHMLRP